LALEGDGVREATVRGTLEKVVQWASEDLFVESAEVDTGADLVNANESGMLE
jgi:hypothetical protein